MFVDQILYMYKSYIWGSKVFVCCYVKKKKWHKVRKNHLKYIAGGSQWHLHSPSKSQGKSSCGFTHARTKWCGRLLREWKPASAVNFDTHYLISEALKFLFLTMLKKNKIKHFTVFCIQCQIKKHSTEASQIWAKLPQKSFFVNNFKFE